MEKNGLEWSGYLRAYGHSLYVYIPAVFVKSNKLQRDQEIRIRLTDDGNLKVLFAKGPEK